MTALQFNSNIKALIAMAFDQGVSRGQMSALDVAGILSNHTTGVLNIINQAQHKAMESTQTAKEIVMKMELQKK